MLSLVIIVVPWGSTHQLLQPSVGDEPHSEPWLNVSSDTPPPDAVAQCAASVRHRAVVLKGPMKTLLFTGPMHVYDRVNLVMFGSDMNGSHFSRIEIPTYALPTREFVEEAYDGVKQFVKGGLPHHVLQSSVAQGSRLTYLLWCPMNYSGHSLELLMDAFGGLISILETAPLGSWDALEFVVHDYYSAGYMFVDEYLNLLRAAAAESTTSPLLRSATWVVLSNITTPLLYVLPPRASLVYVSPLLDETPCQRIAQHMWPALLRRLQRGRRTPLLPKCEQSKCILLKVDAQLSHVTPHFFSLPPNLVGATVLREDLPKAARLWAINTARVLVDSWGANAQINRLLTAPASRVQRLTLVHPDAPPQAKRLCSALTKKRAMQSFRCVNHSFLDAETLHSFSTIDDL